jgi:catechol 2,3-dioxygenase-like lactoylglutathione lyase family enzyme
MPRPFLLLAGWLIGVGSAAAADLPPRTPQALAARMDAHLADSLRATKAVAAPAAGDAEFLRRVYLDLVGRIPTAVEARRFLDDRSAGKRTRLVESLLASAGHRAHTAQVWRALLVPQATANLRTQQRLECAQCHDHPFDKWTRQQAWEAAAFFAGVAPLEPEVRPAPGLANRREPVTPGTSTRVTARFLDGSSPDRKEPDPRRAFADWLTRRDNPYFARVMANRVWANLFGVGLVDPVDEWGPHNPPSHPKLLDELAAAYAAAGFDARFLVRAITASAAYRRTSRLTHPSQTDPRALARMNVKGLSAEQLFDSLATATGYRDPVPLASRAVAGWPARSPRGQFLDRFGGGPARLDMQVSILQALALMNGEWLARQTNPDDDPVETEIPVMTATTAPLVAPNRTPERATAVVKFHASLNVSDLDRSVAFYTALLGEGPVKHYPDYAKFEIDEPALVLSLKPKRACAGGPLNHLGLRLVTVEQLRAVQERLRAVGARVGEQDDVKCCYARQTKLWVTDPDETLWEVYVLHEDVPDWGEKDKKLKLYAAPLKAFGVVALIRRAWNNAFRRRPRE